jgi:hypothetical protein
LAHTIKEEIRTFLLEELRLDLSIEKTKITHISKGIEFLGYIFGRKTLFTKQRYSSKIVTRKMTISTLDINMEKVIK